MQLSLCSATYLCLSNNYHQRHNACTHCKPPTGASMQLSLCSVGYLCYSTKFQQGTSTPTHFTIPAYLRHYHFYYLQPKHAAHCCIKFRTYPALLCYGVLYLLLSKVAAYIGVTQRKMNSNSIAYTKNKASNNCWL
jgi:hypothetical protein